MKKQIILLIICGVVIFALGGGVGIFYKSQQTSPQVEKANAVVKMLSSPLISPITTYGEIKNISSDRIITLIYNGTTIAVKMKADAKILAIKDGAQVEVTFQDLKVSDFINITLNISQDFTIEGKQIFIIPTAKPNL